MRSSSKQRESKVPTARRDKKEATQLLVAQGEFSALIKLPNLDTRAEAILFAASSPLTYANCRAADVPLLRPPPRPLFSATATSQIKAQLIIRRRWLQVHPSGCPSTASPITAHDTRGINFADTGPPYRLRPPVASFFLTSTTRPNS